MHFTDEHSFDVVKTVTLLVTFFIVGSINYSQPLKEILIYS